MMLSIRKNKSAVTHAGISAWRQAGLVFAAPLLFYGVTTYADSESVESSPTPTPATENSENRSATPEDSSFRANMSGLSTGSNGSTSGSSSAGSTYTESNPEANEQSPQKRP